MDYVLHFNDDHSFKRFTFYGTKNELIKDTLWRANAHGYNVDTYIQMADGCMLFDLIKVRVTPTDIWR
jgi:hypothetical protein